MALMKTITEMTAYATSTACVPTLHHEIVKQQNVIFLLILQ